MQVFIVVYIITLVNTIMRLTQTSWGGSFQDHLQYSTIFVNHMRLKTIKRLTFDKLWLARIVYRNSSKTRIFRKMKNYAYASPFMRRRHSSCLIHWDRNWNFEKSKEKEIIFIAFIKTDKSYKHANYGWGFGKTKIGFICL